MLQKFSLSSVFTITKPLLECQAMYIQLSLVSLEYGNLITECWSHSDVQQFKSSMIFCELTIQITSNVVYSVGPLVIKTANRMVRATKNRLYFSIIYGAKIHIGFYDKSRLDNGFIWC